MSVRDMGPRYFQVCVTLEEYSDLSEFLTGISKHSREYKIAQELVNGAGMSGTKGRYSGSSPRQAASKAFTKLMDRRKQLNKIRTRVGLDIIPIISDDDEEDRPIMLVLKKPPDAIKRRNVYLIILAVYMLTYPMNLSSGRLFLIHFILYLRE